MSEPDPEQETVETIRRTFSTTFMAAAQAAERMSRQREQQTREAEAASVQRAQELRQRMEAEKTTARAVTAQTRRPEFWEHASVGDVARAYESAVTWAPVDPAMDTDRRAIASEVKKRFGVDIDIDIDIDELSTLAAVRHDSVLEHADAAQAHGEHAAARQDRDTTLAELDPTNTTTTSTSTSTSTSISAGAAEHARGAAQSTYDSTEARAGRTEALRRAGLDEAAVRSYGYADLGQAKPITDAVGTRLRPGAATQLAPRGKDLTTQDSPQLGA